MARGPGRGPRVDIGKPLLKTPEYVEEDRGHGTPCWVWQRSVNNKGYGRIRRFNAEHLAHRWYYTQQRGEIPDGLVLDHLCRVPRCVRPDHLEAVTQMENCRRGNATKLTLDDVEQIRMVRAASDNRMGYRRIAASLGFPPDTVRCVLEGRSWRS